MADELDAADSTRNFTRSPAALAHEDGSAPQPPANPLKKKGGGSTVAGLATLGGLIGTIAYNTGRVPEAVFVTLIITVLLLVLDAFGCRSRSPLFRTRSGSIVTWTVLIALAAGTGLWVLLPTSSDPVAGPNTVVNLASVDMVDGPTLAADNFGLATTALLPRPLKNTANFSADVDAGEYRFRKLNSNSGNSDTVTLSEVTSDASLSIDARLTDDVKNSSIQLFCRIAENETLTDGYLFSVHPSTGEVALFRIPKPSSDKSVTLWPLTAAPAVRRGTELNSLQLACAGNRISGSVNGSIVASAQDGTFSRGMFGVGIWSRAIPRGAIQPSGSEAADPNRRITVRNAVSGDCASFGTGTGDSSTHRQFG